MPRKNKGVGIAPVELKRLGEMSHSFSERAALLVDEAEKRVSVCRIGGDIDQGPRLCLGAGEVDRVRAHLPDPIVSRADALNPEHEVLMADSVGLALQIVLDTLSPVERLAFVLHEMFDVPFDEIGPMVGRSAPAARQLASRARRRVRGASVSAPDPDLARQRQVVDAFFAAAHRGDFDALVALLDPDVVLRSDGGE